MNHWPFVIAAYAIVLGATAALVLISAAALRRAEKKLEGLKRR